jgi:hypothetical protein
VFSSLPTDFKGKSVLVAHTKRPITQQPKLKTAHHETAQAQNNPSSKRPKAKNDPSSKQPKLKTTHGTKRLMT